MSIAPSPIGLFGQQSRGLMFFLSTVAPEAKSIHLITTSKPRISLPSLPPKTLEDWNTSIQPYGSLTFTWQLVPQFFERARNLVKNILYSWFFEQVNTSMKSDDVHENKVLSILHLVNYTKDSKFSLSDEFSKDS
ncbi:hypothetical protein RCL_jg2272.t1 [Rhizophagus clarus]|uniref:Uncharacterized protein n=1 Tax=Rhizophagus clarus TaxID=94130 RepID=A0A8H3KSC6_9GLOM|nr:hypothetical protein RCL_jg2272.t1 [Rhizophagus clarus]